MRRRSLTLDRHKHALLMEGFAIFLVSGASHDAAASLIQPPASGGQWTILYSKYRPLNLQKKNYVLDLRKSICSVQTEHDLQGMLYWLIEPQVVKEI